MKLLTGAFALLMFSVSAFAQEAQVEKGLPYVAWSWSEKLADGRYEVTFEPAESSGFLAFLREKSGRQLRCEGDLCSLIIDANGEVAAPERVRLLEKYGSSVVREVLPGAETASIRIKGETAKTIYEMLLSAQKLDEKAREVSGKYVRCTNAVRMVRTRGGARMAKVTACDLSVRADGTFEPVTSATASK